MLSNIHKAALSLPLVYINGKNPVVGPDHSGKFRNLSRSSLQKSLKPFFILGPLITLYEFLKFFILQLHQAP